MIDLNTIKNEHKWLRIIFEFLDKVISEIKKHSSEIKTDRMLTFVDYNDGTKYHVDIEKANLILDQCYSECVFKKIVSEYDYYKKVKKLSLDLKIKPSTFDLMFRNIFVGAKNWYFSDCYGFNYKPTVEKIFYKTVFWAHMEVFENVPKAEDFSFEKKSNFFLDKMVESKLLFFNQRNVTCDEQFKDLFKLSSHTFKFYRKGVQEQDYESHSQVITYLFLVDFLKVHDILNIDLLTKLDKVVHMIVLSSIKDESNLRFFNNEFGDNSYYRKYYFNVKKEKNA